MNMTALMAKIASAKKEFVKNEKPVTPKIGENHIVLLPGWNAKERETFYREFGGHYIKVGGKVAGFYPCDEIIYGKPCPVCERLAEVSRASNDDSVNQFVKDCRANRQYLVNAIVVGENNNQPVVMALSKTVFEQLINVISGWGEAVFDEKNPQVIQITRTGTGFDTKYIVTVLPKKFALPEGTMDKVKNLDQYVDQRTETMLNKALMAIGSGSGAGMAAIASAPSHQAIAYQQAPVQQFAQQPKQPVEQPMMDVREVTPVMTQALVQSAPWEAQPMTQAPVAPQPQVAQPAPQAQAPIGIDADMESLLSQLNGL